jgi:hypothetical protein
MRSGVRAIIAVLAMAISTGNSFGAQATLEWEDGAFCQFSTRFDPAKYREETLRNTIDVIYGDNFFDYPSLAIGMDENGRIKANIAEFQQVCERKKEFLTTLPLLALPGVEAARKSALEEVDEKCKFDTLNGRAALGDPAALREFTPAVAKCSIYIDALEGKRDLRTAWRDVIASTCRRNASPDACEADFLAAETRSNADARIRRDVLDFGWKNCADSYLRDPYRRERASLTTALEKQFRRLFKVKAYPCAD